MESKLQTPIPTEAHLTESKHIKICFDSRQLHTELLRLQFYVHRVIEP